MENKKVVFYKNIWFWIAIISCLLFFIILIISNINTVSFGVGTAGINEKEFDMIIVGKTTNFEISSIIDTNDEWDNDGVYEKCVEQISNSSKDHVYTYVYKYYGEKSGYAIITMEADYTNGHYYNDVIVTKKEKFNLK